MKKYAGTLYRSRWDGSTWSLIGITAVFCLMPIIFDDDGIAPLIICGIALLFVIVTMTSIYYRIDGNNLVIYQFFIPSAFPIDKISEIYPTKTILSAPATSLTHRLAIKFSDRKVLKSSMPIIISPANQSEFLKQLLSINPNINFHE